MNARRVDILTVAERSKRMSLIRGKWTRQEIVFHNYLKGHKIRHQMHPYMHGSPDLILKDFSVAIFLQGCFWHGCPIHYRKPVNNSGFWAKKIVSTMERDRKSVKLLKKNGWKVVQFWEHDLPPKMPYSSIGELMQSIPVPVSSRLRRNPSD